VENIMKTCEAFQAQLLEHLYGLLDEEDRRLLGEHLPSCPACQTALTALDGKRKLLAAAAREEFPGVYFQPPREVARIAEPKASPKVLAEPWLPRWGRWAIAAGVLLTVGLVGGWTWKGFADVRHAVDLARADEDRAKKEQQDKAQAYQKDLQSIQDEILKLDNRRDRKRLKVEVTGPETIQAGARNQFLIHTTNLKNEPVSAEVKVRLCDPSGQEVVKHQGRELTWTMHSTAKEGQCDVVLPPDLPQKPGTRFALQVEAKGKNGGQVTVDARNLELVAPLYLTHLTTDKPMYQPGEAVRFRSLTLERFSLKPVAKLLTLNYRITAPNGAEVYNVQNVSQVRHGREKDYAIVSGPDNQPVQGMGTGVYPLPVNAPGGVYTLTVTLTEQDRATGFHQVQQRPFIVNRYEKPFLNKELEFTRKSYGPRDEVVAACRVARVGGGKPVANQEVKATVQVDGKTYDSHGKVVKGTDSGISLRTDAQGAVSVRFRLPDRIEQGEATVGIRFTDGGNQETLVRPIPIVLKKLNVEFFPEGGDLVAGLSNRVYFQARTTRGKPAELKGRIVDADGKVLARVQTLNDDKEPGANQGMGVFDLDRPVAGQKYELEIDSPAGIEGRYVLPEVKADGVVLTIPRAVITDDIPVTVRNGTRKRKLLVGAYCRGHLMDHAPVTAKEGAEVEIHLKPQAGVGGVYRVTVFEQRQAEPRLKPVAERLIFRQPTGRVNLTLKTDKGRYTPGERVRLFLNASDEHKQPAPAILLVSVVDKSVLTLADEKTARSMPTHFFLTTEVRGPEDLEHADFLLTDHAQAARALDLLLGTQGWRRFAEQQDPKAFQKEHKADGERLVRVSGRTMLAKGAFPQVVPQDQDEFLPQKAKLEVRRNDIHRNYGPTAQATWNKTREAQQVSAQATAQLDEFWTRVRTGGLVLLCVLLVAVGAGALAIGLYRTSQNYGRAQPFYATGLCALVLVVVVGVVTIAPLVPNAAQGSRDRAEAQTMARHAQNAAGLARDDADRDKDKANDAREMAMKDKAENRGMGGPAFGGANNNMPPAPGVAPMPPGGGFPMKGAGQGVPPLAPPWMADRPGGGRNDLRARKPFAPAGGAGGRPLIGAGIAQKEKMPIAQPIDRNDDQVDGNGQFRPQAFVVREFAHQHKASKDNVRTDFAETLYWHPVLVLADGKGEVAFDLCDSVTTFRVQAFAHTLDGRLGAAQTELESRLPVTLQPTIPIEVTHSDKITIPLGVTNTTDLERTIKVQVEAKGLLRTDLDAGDWKVPQDSSVRRLYSFQPKIAEGEARVLFKGRCEPFATDSIERLIKVVPEGFPMVGQHSGLLENNDKREILLPREWVKGTLRVQAQVFPSTLADLQKGLEGLLREPCGCFEQTSTSNYPNVLILDYLKETDQSNPEVVRRARQLLDSGYQKLTSFECLDPAQKKRGYEWFGGTAPPHEALTAYGLLQFRDMARVYTVDKAMLKRTRKYLMGQKDGKGGFNRNARALDRFGGAPQHITDAYIVWSLTESGKEDDVDKELAALTKQAQDSKDPYFLALVANSQLNRDRRDDAFKLLEKLAKAQKDDGHLDGAETSITNSGGRDLQIETTALTVLSWLKANRPEFTRELNKAVKWISQQRGGFGGFGSTQSTILALKALIAYTKANKKTATAGDLILYVNDKEVSRQSFPAGAQDVLTVSVPKADETLQPGLNKVRVQITGKNVFPYTLSWSYRTLQPANPAHCPVELTTRLDRKAADEVETVRLTATVENKSGKGQGMAVAIIGLPGGLTLPEDLKQLKNYVRLRDKDARADAQGSYISAFEIRGRELVLYWRTLARGEKIQVNLDLTCRVPGTYSGPASRAYLYYNSDQKFWVKPLAVAIQAKEEK
jgi:hypothetical protein